MKTPRTLASIAVAGGLVIHLGILFLLRIEGPVPRTPPDSAAAVSYIGDLAVAADPELRQQALLRDSAPLFMPTPWNLASELSGVASLQEATRAFDPLPPLLLLPSASPGLRGDTAAGDPAALELAMLPRGPVFVLEGLDRASRALPSASPSAPSILAVRLDRPAPARSLPLALTGPLGEFIPSALWAPARFYIHLALGTPAGPALLSQSSGFPEWDQALLGFIGSLPFHRHLGQGYYQITVFP